MESFFKHLIEEFHFPLRNPVLIFSTILFIILLSPILLRKVKIPSIIGLILSGVIIGPNGIGLIGAKLVRENMIGGSVFITESKRHRNFNSSSYKIMQDLKNKMI